MPEESNTTNDPQSSIPSKIRKTLQKDVRSGQFSPEFRRGLKFAALGTIMSVGGLACQPLNIPEADKNPDSKMSPGLAPTSEPHLITEKDMSTVFGLEGENIFNHYGETPQVEFTTAKSLITKERSKPWEQERIKAVLASLREAIKNSKTVFGSESPSVYDLRALSIPSGYASGYYLNEGLGYLELAADFDWDGGGQNILNHEGGHWINHRFINSNKPALWELIGLAAEMAPRGFTRKYSQDPSTLTQPKQGEGFYDPPTIHNNYGLVESAVISLYSKNPNFFKTFMQKLISIQKSENTPGGKPVNSRSGYNIGPSATQNQIRQAFNFALNGSSLNYDSFVAANPVFLLEPFSTST